MPKKSSKHSPLAIDLPIWGQSALPAQPEQLNKALVINNLSIAELWMRNAQINCFVFSLQWWTVAREKCWGEFSTYIVQRRQHLYCQHSVNQQPPTTHVNSNKLTLGDVKRVKWINVKDLHDESTQECFQNYIYNHVLSSIKAAVYKGFYKWPTFLVCMHGNNTNLLLVLLEYFHLLSLHSIC